ncbi:RCC1 domain-containing protein [Kiritimatiella glycovorans]|uniref:Cell cycle control protein n=1 Tax=Kiritimatiella glycovorans TaxID=1307763 RepID=A0A0G3EC54_9BACT|nr:hypothetical protein [Kiritimatiella glycovorans]AKJ63858.1 Cell cycle control protein [Kiritimatiella glycovorans]
MAVSNLTDVIAIAACRDQSFAVRSNGTVYAWGRGDEGRLGLGTNVSDRSSATLIPGLTNIVSVAAGTRHALALQNDGTLWAWGANSGGLLCADSEADILSSPVLALFLADTDFDDLPDYWERVYYGGVASVTGESDSDVDFMSARQEYAWGSCPTNADSNADGLFDYFAWDLGLDPLKVVTTNADADA